MSYARVIPRDLFNEANLLKCFGQLYLKTENKLGISIEGPQWDDGFNITQDESDGSITVENVHFSVWGRKYKFKRPLNSREPWPLYLVSIDGAEVEEISVFTDEGELTSEFCDML